MPITSSVLKDTIASGAALGSGFKVYGGRLVGIQMPSSWTTANLTFQVATDGSGGTYQNAEDDAGNELTVTAAASLYLELDPKLFKGVTHVKVRSGTSATAVNQGADRILDFVLEHDIR